MGEFDPHFIGYHCRRGGVTPIKGVAPVLPYMVGDYIVERSFGYLQRVVASEEKAAFKSWVGAPRAVRGAGPPFFKDHSADILGILAIKCHVFDILWYSTVWAFSLRLVAPKSCAYWEGVAAKQPHETFDLGGGEGAQVSLSNFVEIDVVFFHPFVRFDAVGACAERLCPIQFTVLVAFDELRAVFLGWSHVLLVQ